MLNLGAHLSVAKGYYRMGQDALKIGANTLQFFARNPRGAKAKDLDPEDLEKFRILMEENAFAPILAHAPYTMNACSKDPHVRELAKEMITGDLKRMELLPGNYYNFHPGSHVGQGIQVAAGWIVDMLNEVLHPDMQTTVLLETMAGKGSEVGRTFEELAQILMRVECQERIGVCMDACHVWDGGYDIVTGLDRVLAEFDAVVGLHRLKAFHMNDSMNERGSHKDRHARIGEGHIGKDAAVRILTHPKLIKLPFILETPNDLDGHAEEIRMLRKACQDGFQTVR